MLPCSFPPPPQIYRNIADGLAAELREQEQMGKLAAMSVPRSVKCPTCKKTGDWFANPFGPFCSKRCRLVDLGKWFGEENKISERLRPEHFQSFEDLPPGENPDEPEELK